MAETEPASGIPPIHSENYAFEYLFPFPLADLFRRYRVSRHAFDQVGYLLSAAEASLKFLVAIASCLAPATTELRNALNELSQAAATPSFGTWRRLLEIFANTDPQPRSQMSDDLLRCVQDRSGADGAYLKSVRALVELRNDFIHGGTITNDVAESLLPDVALSLRAAFREMLFLVRYPFIVTEEVHRLRFPACFEVVVRKCQGSNPTFPFELWRLDDPIDPGVPLLISPDLSEAYRLHPIVAVFRDPQFQLPKCWFYLRKRTKAYWHSYEYGEQRSLEGPPDLQEEMRLLLRGELDSKPLPLMFHLGKHPVWSRTLVASDQLQLPAGYRMLGEIAHGRYATVFKVIHSGLQEVRALKVLSPEAALDGHVRRRFEIEAQLLSQLRGKQVAINVFEYGDLPTGLPYLVLQYVEGGSLEEAMRRWGPKPPADVLDLGVACFAALEVIHASGILHRDIKLSNILLEGENYLFCDFGVAKTQTSEPLTMSGDAIGTVGYAPPEQLEGRWDVRSDIYSLGVCLANLLAGQALPNPRQWLNESLGEDLDLRNALLNALEVIPDNRPPTASAVVERLSGIKRRREMVPQIDDNGQPEGIISGTLQPTPTLIRNVPSWKWVSPDGTVYRAIVPGEFVMGGTKYADERPVHRVAFRERYLVASTLVTNQQFTEFCRTTHYRGEGDKFLFHLHKDLLPNTWRAPDNPVVFVSWRDAKEYILWRCERDDVDYRLPTEAQWEHACRCGSRTVYPWGNVYDASMLNADNVHGHPTPVGSYPANEWGLFDMLGNIWEWCEDVKDVIPREESIFYRFCANTQGNLAINPVNSGPGALVSRRVATGLRVVRGGSFFSEGRNFRPANRRGQFWKDCVRSIGFRLTAHGIPEKDLLVLES